MEHAPQPYTRNTQENKIEQMDTRPTVENLVFGDEKKVFIKTSFPAFPSEGLSAVSYILVDRPSTRSYAEVRTESEKLFPGDLQDPEAERHFAKGYDFSNMPHLFKGFDAVQSWYEEMKSHLSNEDLEALAQFLGIRNIE